MNVSSDDITKPNLKLGRPGTDLALAYFFAIRTGDWSEDGHGKTELFFISCTHPREEFQAALKKTMRECPAGCSPADICRDYEDRYLTKEEADIIKDETSFDFAAQEADGIEYDEDLERFAFYTAKPILAYLCYLVTKFNPPLKAEIAPNQELNWYDTQPEISGIAYGVYGE